MDMTSYCNDCFVRFEELLFHELGQCSRWKPEYVGIDYIQSREIEGNTAEEVIESCIQVMKEDGLVKGINYSLGPEGIFLKLIVYGCVHLPKEAKLKKIGIEPYVCPITNMIFDRILELLNYEITYLGNNMEIDENKAKCIIKCGIWESADKVGMIGNWPED